MAHAQDALACASVMEGYGEVETLYGQGDFEGAASFLQAASVLCPDEPLLLYNLARTLERRSDQLEARGDESGAEEAARRALAAYERFLERGAADADVTLRATARRDALTRELGSGRLPEAISVDEDENEDARHTERSETCAGEVQPWPWVIVGVGVASLVTGIVLGVDAVAVAGEADRAANHRETVRLLSEAGTRETAANVLLVAGGVVIAAGAVWGIVDLIEASQRGRATSQFGSASERRA